MPTHSIDFEPLNRPSGWNIHNGDPRIWWYVRLAHHDPVLLSNKSDARDLESHVSITIGTQVPEGKMLYAGGDTPAPKWGFFACRDDALHNSDSVEVRIAVSRDNFDRILASTRNGQPPTVSVGFGTDDLFEPLIGPITQDKETGAYLWDNEKEPLVVIESCEFKFSRPPISTDVPEPTDEPGPISRGLGIGFTVFWNLIAVLIALAVFNAARSTFETSVVSVLAYIYLILMAMARELPRLLARTELAELTRFYQLRTLVGAPAEENENKYLRSAHKLVNRSSAKYYIDVYGSAVIGLIATYKLVMLLL